MVTCLTAGFRFVEETCIGVCCKYHVAGTVEDTISRICCNVVEDFVDFRFLCFL